MLNQNRSLELRECWTQWAYSIFLIQGINKIITDSGLQGEWCGLIPIGQPSIVTTKGLQYDVGQYFANSVLGFQ